MGQVSEAAGQGQAGVLQYVPDAGQLRHRILRIQPGLTIRVLPGADLHCVFLRLFGSSLPADCSGSVWDPVLD